MKLKDDIIKLSNKGLSSRAIANKLKCSKSHVNNVINNTTKQKHKDDIILPDDYSYNIKKRYIITSAINNTDVHTDTLTCLRVAAKDLGADILVVPIRYKNPTIVLNTGDYSTSWPPELRGCYISRRLQFADDITLYADVTLQATSTTPLSGLSSLPNLKHAIYGHSILQMEAYPNTVEKRALTSHTTGSVSVPCYSNTKQGHKAKALHHLGALLVEVDSSKGLFFIYQLSYSSTSKSIIHLDKEYTVEEGVKQAPAALSLTIGDTHVGDHDKEVHDGVRAINNDLKVLNNHWHDFFNGASVNQHINNNLNLRFHRLICRKSSLSEEVKEMYQFIKKYLDPSINHYFIESNHNDWLDRWLTNPKSNLDIENLLLYHKLNYTILSDFVANRKSVLSGFEVLIRDFVSNNPEYKSRLHVWRSDKELVHSNTYYESHGHSGIGGTRGSPTQFGNLQFSVVVGHTHSAFIRGRAFGTGTSTHLRVGYNKGLTKWTHTSILEYSNGTKTLIHFLGPKYRI